MSDPKTEASSLVEKWHAPEMSLGAGGTDRRQSSDSDIPTAEEIEQWRLRAEKEGYRQGVEQAQQEMKLLQQRWLELINFFEHPLRGLNEEVELQLTQLAITLAQQLVRRELKAEPGEIIGLIRDSVKLLPANSRNLSVVLHPDDAKLVRTALSIDTSDEESSWKLVEDPMMSRGGCEIKAPPSSINATLESRLSALAASVLGGEREQDQ